MQHFSRSSSAAVSSSNNSVTAQSPFATAADGLPAEFVDDFSEPYAPHAGDVNSAGGGLTDDVINSSNEEGNGGGWHAATRQGSLLTMSVRRITLAQPHGEQGQPSGTDEVGLNTDEGAIHCHALGSEANASRIAFDSQPETAGEPAVSAFQSHRDGSGDSDGDWNLDEWPSVTTPTAAEIAAAAGSNGSMSTGDAPFVHLTRFPCPLRHGSDAQVCLPLFHFVHHTSLAVCSLSCVPGTLVDQCVRVANVISIRLYPQVARIPRLRPWHVGLPLAQHRSHPAHLAAALVLPETQPPPAGPACCCRSVFPFLLSTPLKVCYLFHVVY